MNSNFRIERDSMGEMPVPGDAYYGASTQRALFNFPVSSLRLQRNFIRALGLIKYAAAEVNRESGKLEADIAAAIMKAAAEVARGQLDKHFDIDVFQTGSGTSTNMNANEVIANRAVEHLGGSRGDKTLVHPNDHVNCGMSSNDVIPTATHLAALLTLEEELIPALRKLHRSLSAKSRQFKTVVKTGRTHLQDATPITLGQEFRGYAGQIERAISRAQHGRKRLSQLAIGGTAVGTGVNTTLDFGKRVCRKLSSLTGIPVRETSNHFQAQSTIDEVVECSGLLKTIAVSLAKIANDIRWLSSGPRAGLGEIELPAVQPGSSIMPGKTNPVIAESVCQVCAQVVGNDSTITFAGQSGNFELNVMLPVAAYNLLESITILASASRLFAERCIDGIKATNRGPQLVENGLALATALVPFIGYDRSAAIAYEAAQTGQSILAVAKLRTDFSEARLVEILDPSAMTGKRPGKRRRRKKARA